MSDLLSDLLCSLGITANYTGYYYIRCAVELTAADSSHLVQVTKDLYPTVASRFSSTPSRVERNIRHTAELAWKTNPELLRQLAGHPMSQRPKTSQFIAILTAEYKRLLTREDTNGQQTFF